MSSIIPAVRKEDQYSTGLNSSISQLQEFEYGMKENDGKTTDVNSVVTIDVQERSNKISPIFKTDNEPLDAVEQEKQRMARKAEKRHQHLRDILLKVNSHGYPFYVAFYGLVGILLRVFYNAFWH